MTAFGDMKNAMEEARIVQRRADSVASTMAELLVGRLRNVNAWTLRKLKRELRDYNPHTQKWRNE